MNLVEAECEDTVEVTCRIVVKDLDVKVMCVHFDEQSKKWSEKDITDFLPFEEALRIQGMADEMRSKALKRIRKV